MVSLNLGHFAMKRSKIRCALAGLLPANSNSSIRCPSALLLDLEGPAIVGVEKVVDFLGHCGCQKRRRIFDLSSHFGRRYVSIVIYV
jgi:hypothetical protein